MRLISTFSVLPLVAYAETANQKKIVTTAQIDKLLKHVTHRNQRLETNHKKVAQRGLIDLFTATSSVNNYGCWCHFNAGAAPSGEPVDLIDEICKKFHQSKNCLNDELEATLVGSSTCSSVYSEVLTVLQNPFDVNHDLVAECATVNPAEDCKALKCAVDSSYMRDVYNFLAFNSLNVSNSHHAGFDAVERCVVEPVSSTPLDQCCDSYHTPNTCTEPEETFEETDFINADKTIRSFGSSVSECVVNVEDELKYQSCEEADLPRWRANAFELTLDGKIRRVGSDRCWLAPSMTRPFQKIKMRSCDSDSFNRNADNVELRQKFINIEGRLHLESNQNLCVAVDEQQEGASIVLKTCYGDNWSVDDIGAEIVGVDDTIRPFGDDSTCLYYNASQYFRKKNALTIDGAEIFVGDCTDVDHQNLQRRNKFKWIVDESTGEIKSMKDPSFCMTIDHFYPLKQRVNLYRCMIQDRNHQVFEIEDGVIRNGDSCGQYSLKDLSLNGETPLVFQRCAPSLFRKKSINPDN